MKLNKPSSQIDIFIKIVLLSILILMSFTIIKPFVMLIIWSIIIAVSLYPFYQKITRKLSGKKKGAVSSLFIIVLLAVIIMPLINSTQSVIGSSKDIYHKFEKGTLEIPSPHISVKEWPLIGEKVFELWSSSSNDIETFIKSYPEKVESSLGWFFNSFTGLMGAVFLSLFAIIIAGFFMSSANKGHQIGVSFANKVMDGKGVEFMKMCTNTIRSVVKGIILVAVIQAVLSYIGFASIGIGAAGLLAFVLMFAAIIQIPVTLVVIPIIIYVFSVEEFTPAIIFSIYILLVSLLDNLLKPILLAKGLQTPMIIIMIGSIGGMMSQGILGLFIGPVILAIAHKLYINWVREPSETI